jgi:predicted AAA+ superfamily ATPase
VAVVEEEAGALRALWQVYLKIELTTLRFHSTLAAVKPRNRELRMLRRLLARNPVVGIVGARQVGKTTLARMAAGAGKRRCEHFDLEDPGARARLSDPMRALAPLRGLVVLDEIQCLPEVFPVLRVLADRPRTPARFLVLGSASPELLRQSSESLAGRIAYRELGGFALDETGEKAPLKLWRRGGLPRSFLAPSDAASLAWRRDLIRTFLERDLPQLGVGVSAAAMRRFWTMLAHYHGQVWNASEFARSFGVAHTTVRGYLDRLTSALVVRQLLPWHQNISKRQVKSPKVYIKDSGLLHALLGLCTQRDLEGHPKSGASWEGFVIEQIIRLLNADPSECHFWATHAGAELDLLVVRGRRKYGFEIKLSTAPQLTRSMRSAFADLKLTSLDVVHAGKESFPLARGIRALAVGQLAGELKALR